MADNVKLFDLILPKAGAALTSITAIERKIVEVKKELKAETRPEFLVKLESELVQLKGALASATAQQKEWVKSQNSFKAEPGSIVALRKELKELQKQFDETGDAAKQTEIGKRIAEIGNEIGKLNSLKKPQQTIVDKIVDPASLEGLKGTLKDLEIQFEKTGDAVKQTEIGEQIAKIRKEISAIDSKKKPIEALVGDQGSLLALKRELKELEKQFEETGDAATRAAIGEKIQGINSNIVDINRQRGKVPFREIIGQEVGSAVGGAIPGADQLLGVIDKVKSEGAAAGAALAGGLVAGAVITGLAVATTNAIEYANALREVRQVAEQFLGDDSFAANAKAIENVFGIDAKESILAVNASVKEFGENTQDVFDLYQKAVIAGGNASGDFASQVREYSAQFATAGFSAEEFFAVIAIGNREGIFNDKAVDSIKEAGLRLRELTPAAVDALKGIGISQAQIREKIDKEGLGAAIKLVSKQLGQFKDDAPEVGRVLADVFGGPGEDAAIRYIKNFGDINLELDNLIKSTDKLTSIKAQELKNQLAVNEAYTDLSRALDDLTGSTGTAWSAIQVAFVNGLTYVIERVSDWWNGLKAVGSVFSELIGGGDKLANVFTFIGKAITFPLIIAREFLGELKFAPAYFEAFKAAAGFAIDSVTLRFKQARENAKAFLTDLNPFASDADKAAARKVADALDKAVADRAKTYNNAGALDVFKQNLDFRKKQIQAEIDFEKKAREDLRKQEEAAAKAKATKGGVTENDIKAAAELKKKLDKEAELKKKAAEEDERLERRKAQASRDAMAAIDAASKQRIKLALEERSTLFALEEAGAEERLALIRAYEREALQAKINAAIDASAKDQKGGSGFNIGKKFAGIRERVTSAFDESQNTLRGQRGAVETDLASLATDSSAKAIEQRQKLRDELSAIDQQMVQDRKVYNEEIKRLDKEELDEKTKRTLAIIDAVGQFADIIGQALDAGIQNRIDKADDLIQDRTDKINDINRKLEDATGLQKLALEQQLEDEKALLEKAEEEKEKLLRKQANRRKAIALAEAGISIAQALLRSLAEVGFAGFPLASIIISAIGAAQLATIAAAKFAGGGLVGDLPVLSGKRINNSPNVAPTADGDNILAYVKRGEVVLNEEQQMRAGGPGFFRAIGVPGFAAGGFVPPPAPVPQIPYTVFSGLSGGSTEEKMLQYMEQQDQFNQSMYKKFDDIQKAITDQRVILATGDLDAYDQKKKAVEAISTNL